MPYKDLAKKRAKNKEWQRKHKAKCRASTKAWEERNPAYVTMMHRKKRTGLDGVAQAVMWEAQGRRCKICNTDVPNLKGQWTLDHDHVTGKARGFLCGFCNLLLGYSRDRSDVLRRAAAYLECV